MQVRKQQLELDIEQQTGSKGSKTSGPAALEDGAWRGRAGRGSTLSWGSASGERGQLI